MFLYTCVLCDCFTCGCRTVKGQEMFLYTCVLCEIVLLAAEDSEGARDVSVYLCFV